jgi:glutamate/tyrosine decarboxylase-like PLP-dependent enzyme
MGGIYPSPGFEGSRTPVFTVSAYAIMLFLGKNRFINQAKAIHEAVLMIKNFVKKNLEELEVIGDPQICSIAITGKNVALVFDQMTQRGWHLNYINNPIGLSLVITSANLANVENGNFTKDLLDSYNFVNFILIF